jgi:hypothetical protein
VSPSGRYGKTNRAPADGSSLAVRRTQQLTAAARELVRHAAEESETAGQLIQSVEETREFIRENHQDLLRALGRPGTR